LQATVAQPESDRKDHGLLRNKISQIFAGTLYQFSAVRK